MVVFVFRVLARYIKNLWDFEILFNREQRRNLSKQRSNGEEKEIKAPKEKENTEKL